MLFLIVVYMIVAVGLNVVIGLAGLLDLGYIGFYALGAYSVALFGSPDSPVTKKIAETFDLSVGWTVPFVICIPIAIAFALLAGVILGAPTLRLRGDYLAIVTIGFGEIIRIVLRNSVDVTGGPTGVSQVPRPPGPAGDPRVEGGDPTPFFNSIDVHRFYWLALIVLIVLILGVRRLENSRVGRAWLAIREDEDAAGVMGVAAFKYKLWAFAIGACLGAMAGLLFASRQSFIEPNGFKLNLSFLFVAMVVIGGSGGIGGAPTVPSSSRTYPSASAASKGMAPVRVRRGARWPRWCCDRRPPCPADEERENSRTDRKRRRWTRLMADHTKTSTDDQLADGVDPADAPGTRSAGGRVPASPGAPGRSSTSTTSRCGSAAWSPSTTSTSRSSEGEILGLIGPNGAGKTTMLQRDDRRLRRRPPARSRFDGTRIIGRPSRTRSTALGIARTFQNIRLFPEMTALENVMVGCDARHKTSVIGALFRHLPDPAEGARAAG